MKGALVEFASSFGASVPNVVVFQFNPETLRRTWSQPTAAAGSANPLAVRGMPGESFSFTLSLDATDELDGSLSSFLPVGIYSRLAALELLMFPVPASTTPGAGTGTGTGTGDGDRTIPASQLPTVLFVWGAGRIVPVRVTSMTITEKLFDANLTPTHADVAIEMRVLTPDELAAVTGPLAEIAKTAYQYTQGKRSVLAIANLSDAARAVIGLLPVPIP